MPQSPYAKLRVSVNGGAVQTGGITVPASATIQLSADPSASSGVSFYKYEIYGYPVGFACPSGWSTSSSSTYYYLGSVPPLFTLPTIGNWGKFMLRLIVNNAVSTNLVSIPVSQLVDESTALSMLSPNGLADVGLFESNQFSSTWTPPVQASLRAIDTAVTAVAGANAKPPAQLLGASNIASLSGEQTIDGTLTSASRVLLIAQSTSSQNGLWLTASGSWTRPTDFSTDSQVVVGQTVFITSGSVNSHTNWQLVSGNTIAGAKSYSQLVSGSTTATGILPVDAVDTTNNALSGTTAVDGVTLSANVSRVLVVNQTTTSQNGPWVVQAGAWSRPSDYTVDAQVIPGSNIYVKSGTLGSGTNWQQASGTTIAGAKTFIRVQSGRIAPVRAVQAAPFPGTYSANTWTATATGALSSTIFDGANIAIGESVEFNSFGVAAIGNGVYQRVADTASKPTFSRRADLSSSSSFANGVSFDVLDGTKYKGSRRQMLNQSAVTVGTTALSFGTIAPPATVVVDMSKAPYYVKDYPDYNTWFYNDGVDYGPNIRQALWDYKTNTGAVLKLPAANGGKIICNTPFDHYGGCQLSADGVTLLSGISGGHLCVAQYVGPNDTQDYFPQVAASPVDTGGFTYITGILGAIGSGAGIGYTATTPTALSLFRSNQDPAPGGGYTDRQYFYNLSDTGVLIDGWSQFQFDMMFNVELLGTVSPHSQLASCRGRRTSPDAGDVVDSTFYVYLDETGTGKLTAQLRVTDVTKGVYGATTQTGGGSATCTGDATVKPSEDAPNFTIKVITGGTVGTTGPTISYTTNGYSWRNPIALGTANSLALVAYDNRGPNGKPNRLAPAQLVSTSNLASLSGEQTIDSVLTSNSRVLLTAQTTASQNGPWITGAGSWTRPTDYNVDAQVVIGSSFFINQGTVYTGSSWVQETGTTIAGSKTFARAIVQNSDVNDNEQPFTAKVNFGAGTLVAGTTYQIPCSGVNQSIVLTSDTVVSADLTKNWIATLMYDGSTVRFGVSRVGQPRDTSASMATGVAATGIVKQHYWEHTMLGNGRNYGHGENGSDVSGIRGFLGSVRLMNVISKTDGAHDAIAANILPPATTPASLASAQIGTLTGSGQKFFFRPSVEGTRFCPDGTMRRGYICETEAGRGVAWIVPRSITTGKQIANGGIDGITFDCGSDATQRGSGIMTVAWHHRNFKNLRFNGGMYGWCNLGPDFGSSDTDMYFQTRWGYGLRYCNGQLNAYGRWNFQDTSAANYALISVTALALPGTMFMNGEQNATMNCLCLDQMYSSYIGNLSVDMENQGDSQCGREIVRVQMLDGHSLKISGGFTMIESYRAVTATGDTGSGEIVLDNFNLFQPDNKYPPLSSASTTAAKFVRGPGASFMGGGNLPNTATPLTDRPNTLRTLDGPMGPVALTNASGTITWQRARALKLASGVLSTNRTYTLSTAGMQTGDTQRIVLESQAANTVTLVNGGPSGGNIVPVLTIASGNIISLTIRLDENGDLISV